MTTKTALLAATSPFAHFLGLGTRAAAPAPAPAPAKPAKPAPVEGQDDPDTKPNDPNADPDADPDADPNADPDADPNADPDADPNADPDADPDADPNADPDQAGDDDEGDDTSDNREMKPKSKARAARLRERARCAAIFRDKSASTNVALACELAFNTSLSRSAAVAALRSAGTARGRLGQMMHGVVPPVNAGAAAGPAPGSADALVAQIMNAGKSARK
ncbi:hypothetical protein [Acidocella sp.]|uniref:hypothetical protein n=1 Tax=Acidocella sp. TaxID=50710 RepID=UPI00260FDAEE|nr:hypothetical protein [Acidocella sp.]MDD2794370.1 hypothetical protein [Acidocella sp.]